MGLQLNDNCRSLRPRNIPVLTNQVETAAYSRCHSAGWGTNDIPIEPLIEESLATYVNEIETEF
jgi:hypothetical protein